jgi:hypothetical protein
MAATSGPKATRDELILNLDFSNKKSSFSQQVVNLINPLTVNYTRYNNPGFSGAVTRTGEFFKRAPIHELTFIPQNSSMIPRLGSSEGFGFYHGMPILMANTRYLASVYMKSDYPLTTGFSNAYSNIPG